MKLDMLVLALVSSTCLTVLPGCGGGGAEEAGETVDEAVEDAGEAVEDAAEEVEDAVEDGK